MKRGAVGRTWIRVLCLAVCAKLAVFVCMMLNLHVGPWIGDGQATAALDFSSASQSVQGRTDGTDGACHPELLSLLRAKMAAVNEKEALLQKKEQDLLMLQRDIQDKIKQLKELQQRLEGPVKKKRFEEEARLQHLAGVYSSMDPVRAAALLDKLDEETVTKLFAIMKSKKVAKILANMSPEKAARVSQRLYGKDDE